MTDGFYSHGSSYLAFRQVDDSYEGWSAFARELDEAMLDVADEMLRDRIRTDPELRISADERCVMWEWHEIAAGCLPYGTRIEYELWTGNVRPATPHEKEWDVPGVDGPRVYATLDPCWFYNPYAERPRWNTAPRIHADTVVLAKVPVPLDRSALLAVIDAENGAGTAPVPAPRAPVARARTGKAVRLTPPQVELLTDIATNPAMYVTKWGRWHKTATALADKGLATNRWCGGNQTEVKITDDGVAEAIRRGIITAAPQSQPA